MQKLAARPVLCALVQHLIGEHTPHLRNTDPVTLPRSVFDALCCAALAGLEAAEEIADDGCSEKDPGPRS
jgi:hypothetical protein